MSSCRASRCCAASWRCRAPPSFRRSPSLCSKLFGDPLLVREGHGMTLTARGEALQEPVRTLIEQTCAVLGVEPEEVATRTRTVRIMTSAMPAQRCRAYRRTTVNDHGQSGCRVRGGLDCGVPSKCTHRANEAARLAPSICACGYSDTGIGLGPVAQLSNGAAVGPRPAPWRSCKGSCLASDSSLTLGESALGRRPQRHRSEPGR